MSYSDAVVQRCSVKKCVLRNFAKFTGKHLCQSLLACNFIKKETLAQVFSCEFCEISKNTLFHRTPLVAASTHWMIDYLGCMVFKIGFISKETTGILLPSSLVFIC